MPTTKTKSPTRKANKPVPAPKPELKKPVIVFYKNNEKGGWQLFPQICFNKDIAKKRVKTMVNSDLVKCLDVPEELQNG